MSSVVFHVSPQARRVGILQRGLLASADRTGMGAVYFTDRLPALLDEFDVWVVPASSLCLQPDTTTEAPRGETWWAHYGDVRPQDMNIVHGLHNSRGERIGLTDESAGRFWLWFGASQCLDAMNRPEVLYHGTGSEFDSFDLDCVGDLGVHLGNRRQADHFAKRAPGHKGRLLLVYASIENPLRLRDTFDNKTTAAQDTIWQLGELGVISDQEAMDLRALSIANHNSGKEGVKSTWVAIRGAITAAGFDGVVYENDNAKEGEGDSWIAFSSEQIKGVDNVGLWSVNDPRFRDADSRDLCEEQELCTVRP